MARCCPLLMALFLMVGCMPEPVREDRAADWGRDGGTVAFQHDKEGVYVADKDGNNLKKIFEPDETVLATSRPLNSPTDGRLIFTTAYDPEGRTRPEATFPSLAAPEGNIVSQRPVRYTCWLRAEPSGDDQPAPQELFTARCEHVGYIAAGLAVRWRPDGQHLLFIDSTPNSLNQHGLYEFDLRTEKTRRVFPQLAEAMIFDFTPLGSQLVCVTGATRSENSRSKQPETVARIWIGNPDNDASWWNVPGSGRPAVSELPSLIESLRASRPVWTADDSQFACVTSGPGPVPGQPAKSLLQVTPVLTRTPQTVYECDGQLADLAWSPDGTRLGFVERRSDSDAALRFYDGTTGISEPVNTTPVRKFAGFDRSGARYVYVLPDESGLPDPSQQWALLLAHDRLARDKVIVAQTRDTAAATEVFTGMRVTFPVWSPSEDRLSLWITFVPRYQSLLSTLRRWGLLPGDPAATLDLATGQISWLAVTPAEELQVGHYYLLKKDYARAWEWYERANQKLPPREPPHDFQEFTRMLGAPERSQLFEYHCLQQLGRHDVAEARLRDFEKNFFPADAAASGETAASINGRGPIFMAEIVRQLGTEAPFLMRLIHDLYISEVFLSVDAPEAGIALLREQVHSEDDAANRLSRKMAIAQLLLIAGRYDEYLALCPDFLMSLEVAARESPAEGDAVRPADFNQGLSMYGSLLCLAPLFRHEFLTGLAEDSLREAIESWESRRSKLDTMSNSAIDLFLRAAHQSLGNAEQVQSIEARLTKQEAARAAFGEKSIDESVRDLFALPRAFGQLP